MLILLLITFFFFSLYGIRLGVPDSANYLNRDLTTQIRGIAILGILIAHCIVLLYGDVASYNKIIRWFFTLIAPVGVAIFLFLSGFGCNISIAKALNFNWLFKKVGRIYITLGIILIVEYLIALMLGMDKSFFPKPYSFIKDFILLQPPPRATGWYLIVQTLGYLTLYGSKRFLKSTFLAPLFLFWLFFVMMCIYMHKQGCWWVSSLCFPLGVLFAEYSSQINQIISKYRYKLLIIFITLIITLCISTLKIHGIGIILLNLCVCITIAILSIFVSLKSKILNFMGKYSLEIYLIHSICIFFYSKVLLNFPYENNLKIIFTIVITTITAPLLSLLYIKIEKAIERIMKCREST